MIKGQHLQPPHSRSLSQGSSSICLWLLLPKSKMVKSNAAQRRSARRPLSRAHTRWAWSSMASWKHYVRPVTPVHQARARLKLQEIYSWRLLTSIKSRGKSRALYWRLRSTRPSSLRISRQGLNRWAPTRGKTTVSSKRRNVGKTWSR